jgi:hypothetical protein
LCRLQFRGVAGINGHLARNVPGSRRAEYIFFVHGASLKYKQGFIDNQLSQSFNREEAELEAALLRAAGARLHPDLGPIKNPWGSMDATPTATKVYSFVAVNGWLAGGFK